MSELLILFMFLKTLTIHPLGYFLNIWLIIYFATNDQMFQQSVVEEAIIYIEELQKQLVSTMQAGEGCENWKDNKTNDVQ